MPFSTRQRRIFPSTSPLTTCFPSTRNATDDTPPRPSILIVFAEEGRTSLDSRLLVSIPYCLPTHSPFPDCQSLPADILGQGIRAIERRVRRLFTPGMPSSPCIHVSPIFMHQFAHLERWPSHISHNQPRQLDIVMLFVPSSCG